MLNILCFITVTVMHCDPKWFGKPIMVQITAKGRVISETDESYIVDFSKEAQEQNYIGDYKRREVSRIMCRLLK